MAAARVPMPSDTPLTKANLLAALVEGTHEMSLQLLAWQRFGEDVQAWLKERGLGDDFGAFQEQRQKQRDARPKRPKR